jgi:hypothetical protein
MRRKGIVTLTSVGPREATSCYVVSIMQPAERMFPVLLVAGFPTARICLQGSENTAFGPGELSRSTVPFSWGRKWRNVSVGGRSRRN